jgi:GT2 family glycosyltransferase
VNNGPLTRGCLPAKAFEHVEPTAMAVVDLDGELGVRTPEGVELELGHHHRDALLLVRLHEDPVGLIHLAGEQQSLSLDELVQWVWSAAVDEINGHVLRCGCSHELTSCPSLPPPSPEASVAVVIPTVGRAAQLQRCLRSLLSQRCSEFEAIVVDNRPEEGDARRVVTALAAEDSRIRYVAEPREGSSVARNRGVSETHADLVAFADDDVVLDPRWLDSLVSSFSDPSVTASSGMVLPLELETEAQKVLEQYGGFSKGVNRQVFDLQQGRAEAPLFYPFFGDVFGSGGSMAFRRVNFVAAGGFDPALGGGSPARSGEDIYAFSTAILHGGRIVYEPRALCWHEHRRDGAALRDQIFDYGAGLGAILTKAATSQLRFYPAAARAVPLVAQMTWRRRSSRNGASESVTAFPSDLIPAQRAGMLRGPQLYVDGVRRARKLGLDGVIRGEAMTGTNNKQAS